MGCIAKCGAKLILIIMSVVFSLAGVFLFFFGLISMVNQNMLLRLLGTPESIIAYLGAEDNEVLGNVVGSGVAISIAGLLMIGLGFIGWIGACCGCRLCLLGYAVAIMVVFALEIALIVIIALAPGQAESAIINDMNTNLKYYVGTGMNYNDQDELVIADPDIDMNYSWDYLQIQGTCCGSYNYTSWQLQTESAGWNNNYRVCTSPSSCTVYNNTLVPLSCCKVTDPGFYPDNLDDIDFVDVGQCLTTASAASTNQEGCFITLRDTVTNYSNVIIAIAAVSLAIEIVNIVAACYVFKNTGLVM